MATPVDNFNGGCSLLFAYSIKLKPILKHIMEMKKIILLLIATLPITAIAQKKYTIRGQVADSGNSGMAYLRYMSNSRPLTDSAEIVDGKFMFSAPLNSITIANLSISHADGKNDIKSVYLEPAIINVVSATPFIQDATINGSPVNDDAALLNKVMVPVEAQFDALNKEWALKIEKERADTALFNRFNERSNIITKEYNAAHKRFAFDHPNSYIGLTAYAKSRAIDLKDPILTEKDFNRFSAEVRASDIGKAISSMIEGAKGNQGGTLAMNFTQKDVNDKPVKLSDFRGKFVLLDFWASWCKPCRAESPTLVKAYHDYKDKNFTILSVSLEKPGDRASWLKAINQDGMVWNNVSDLNYWQNDAAVKYGITSIPANFLIDPSGKIVARNLRGKDLENKLAELIK